ncbi:MAG: hypothetical protein ACJKTH_03850 [Patescibacteria group bacterium UBA2163]
MRRFAIFGVLIIVGMFIGTFLTADSHPIYSIESESYNRAYWDTRINKVGAQDAFSEFKKKNQVAPFERRHLSTHIIGELFYEHEGVAGIRYCDASFSFGCFHGFFGRAISEEGVSVISELDTQCVNAYSVLGTGCQHGIGHGIMEYVGYESVSKALELCAKTTQVTQLLGCTSGVFMEYNTPLVVGPDGEIPKPREFNKNDPYTPCTEVDEVFRESCYFELGQWFLRMLNNNIQQQKAVCGDIASSIYRERCFMGIGSNLAPSTEYNAPRVREHCAAFGSLGEVACLAGASWSFYALDELRDEPEQFCVLVSPQERDRCLRLADLTEGIEDRP